MDVYLGTILQVAFNFAPVGWNTCSGQILPVNQNTALFSLIGTFYGGNGTTSFGLPNLQGRVALGVGSLAGTTYTIGEAFGQASVSLTTAELPPHTHSAVFTPAGGAATQVTINALQAAGGSGTPSTGALLAESGTTATQPKIYAPAGASGTQVALGGVTVTGGGGSGSVQIGLTGSGAPVSTMPPYLVIQNIIATSGIYPARQ